MKREQKKLALSVLLAGILSLSYVVRVQAGPGDYDLTFGFLGTSMDHVEGRKLYPYALTQQGDGKLLVCGRFRSGTQTTDRLLVRRYLYGGSVDTSFGIGGFAVAQINPPNANLNGVGWSAAIQADGKIVVAGGVASGSSTLPVLWRFTALGELDATFGSGGRVILTTSLFSAPASLGVAVVRNQIVTGFLASPGHVVLTRLNPNGGVDPHFGVNGYVEPGLTPYSDLVVDPSTNRILIGGYVYLNVPAGVHPAVQRFDRDGHEDGTFGPNGIAVLDAETPECPSAQPHRTTALDVQSDGKVIVGGFSEIQGSGQPPEFSSNFVARLRTDGILDLTFGVDGFAESCDGRTAWPFFRVSRMTNQIVTVLGPPVNYTGNSDLIRFSASGIQNLTFPAIRPVDLVIQIADDKVVTVQGISPPGDIKLARFLP
jgi:uncharacterized delta-60 repeat protein